MKHSDFYIAPSGERRVFGIYAPVLDRFVFLEEFDLWTTLEVAEILSSRIQVNIYAFVRPLGMSQENFDLYAAPVSGGAKAIYPTLSIYDGTPVDAGRLPATDAVCSFAEEVAASLFDLNYAHAVSVGERHMIRKYLPTTFDCTHLEPLAAKKRALYEQRDSDA